MYKQVIVDFFFQLYVKNQRDNIGFDNIITLILLVALCSNLALFLIYKKLFYRNTVADSSHCKNNSPGAGRLTLFKVADSHPAPVKLWNKVTSLN